MSSEVTMDPQAESSATETPAAVTVPAGQASEASIPELVGDVYESAPPDERGRLLEQLLRPLGALSLFRIAGGIFVKARLNGGWQDLHIRLEDIQGIRANHVIALVEHVQQVSIEAVDGLAQMLTASSVLAGSAAAVVLASVLVQRSRGRRRGAVEDASGAA